MEQAGVVFILAAVFVAVLLIAAASLVVWAAVLTRAVRGEPIVAPVVRRPVPWRAFDVIVVVLLVSTAMVLVGAIAGRHRAPDPEVPELAMLEAEGAAPVEPFAEEDQAADEREEAPDRALSPRQLATMAVVQPLLMVVAIGYLIARSGATWTDLGWVRASVGSDILLGLGAYVAAVLPVYGLQLLLTRLFPSEHALSQTLLQDATPLLLVLGAFMAIIVAPVTEEFFFRVLLQGWLESVEHRLAPGWAMLPVGAVPIMISSVLFAMGHAGYGPDPIPIFTLAVVLGYLYQRTHRFVPVLVVHLCLNGSSMLMLGLHLLVERLGGVPQ